jgi:alkylresorcinol/alkylpyrone synthase
MPAPNPRILSVATALPPHRIPQGEVKEFAQSFFGASHRDVNRLLPVFDNVQVEGRNFCVPKEWFAEPHGFPEKNALYVENALALSDKAARRALDRAGLDASDVGAIYFASTTGLATPSLDSRLIFELGLSENVRRVPLWGLGCAAGAGGLARAADHARLYPEKPVLLVNVELCGLTFQHGDRSKANVISAALFADGAAAAVLGGPDAGGEGPEILGSHAVTWPGTESVMGWDIVETGFKVVLSKSVPEVVRTRVPENLADALASVGLTRDDLRHFVIHPGGAKVLDAFEEVLGLEPGALHFPREVLREHGNMSSVTVLFILERLLESGECSPGEYGILSAMGPGFSAEHVFFRC